MCFEEILNKLNGIRNQTDRFFFQRCSASEAFFIVIFSLCINFSLFVRLGYKPLFFFLLIYLYLWYVSPISYFKARASFGALTILSFVPLFTKIFGPMSPLFFFYFYIFSREARSASESVSISVVDTLNFCVVCPQ